MPNYLVNHTLLAPGPTNKDAVAFKDGDRAKFLPGQIVSEKMLTDAGFDIDRLATKKPGGFSAAIIAQAEPSYAPAAQLPADAKAAADAKGQSGT